MNVGRDCLVIFSIIQNRETGIEGRILCVVLNTSDGIRLAAERIDSRRGDGEEKKIDDEESHLRTCNLPLVQEYGRAADNEHVQLPDGVA